LATDQLTHLHPGPQSGDVRGDSPDCRSVLIYRCVDGATAELAHPESVDVIHCGVA
jgi:hypothetical protein